MRVRYIPRAIQLLKNSFFQITNLNIRLGYLQPLEMLIFLNGISAMQSLKKLKLRFELPPSHFSGGDHPFNFNIIFLSKLYNLESIEFESISKSESYLQMDLNQYEVLVEECPKLKCIGFRSDTKLKCFGEIGSEKLGLGDNWKLISTPRRYLLHKVMSQ
ncbi:hypothetical protein CONCODRAFT_13062 [Conidiobolus coronatus NRRL 28638]|uniref:F-box domain-containing protein n=1 Tax=Conidiobolus coronatus (strain ATCC 28846 / CBS 209.66 / NRRL 28638) TaxID=796925 RepID=A0A137NRL3_CONC2|nr:hypothetical protein CONCODRAFT_13062 [Conidiobolus coronatus NRRL 28638]|eukprot:KXN65362.1 hypothetical protein CONCODRAFT_13062 [Conidiobolus coronatus NRRL 28638]